MTEADYLARASDPTTAGEVLEALWQDLEFYRTPLEPAAQLRVRHAIARNPSLPLGIAAHCFGQLAGSLAENPVLPLLLLENPALADAAPDETLMRMVRRNDAPPVLLEILTRHKTRQVREAARLHIALYGEATEEQVRAELAALPIGGKDKLATLHAWEQVPGWLAKKHKLKPAQAPTLPPQIEGQVNDEPLTDDERRRVRAQLAALPYSWQIKELMAELERQLGAALTKSETFRLLAKHSRLEQVVCEYPATPLDVLIALRAGSTLLARRDADATLKAAGAALQMEHLATVGLTVVLALAHVVGEGVLHEAALSSRWLRRLGAALNPTLSEKDRKRLVDDANAIVRAVARDTSLRDRIMDYGCDGAV